MGKNVITIPATISKFTAAPLASPAKRKVAAYARVSTDHEEQQNSYEAQVKYYTNYIKSRDDWIFVGVYADMYNQRLIQWGNMQALKNAIK